MTRTLKVAAAQIGRVDFDTPRKEVIDRMKTLLKQAHEQKVQLVLFPETCLTTFFPRFLLEEDVLKTFYEIEDSDPSVGVTNSKNVKDFFEYAKQLGIDVAVGYAEQTPQGERYNTSSYVSGESGKVLNKYRKIHLPGTVEPFDTPNAINQLEKRYFKPGDLGFQAFRASSLKPTCDEANDKKSEAPIVGQLICNDRRWAEAWRCYGLQGIELVLCGFNTTAWAPDLIGYDHQSITKERFRELTYFHHKLVMQAHSYTNSTFSISAARAGWDDGKYELIGGSTIINPEGEIIAESKTIDDELVVAEIDLDQCRSGKKKTFDFARHRRTEHYSRIVDQTGVVEPPK